MGKIFRFSIFFLSRYNKKNNFTGLISKGDKNVHSKPVNFFYGKDQKYFDTIINKNFIWLVSVVQIWHFIISRQNLLFNVPKWTRTNIRSNPPAQILILSVHGILLNSYKSKAELNYAANYGDKVVSLEQTSMLAQRKNLAQLQEKSPIIIPLNTQNFIYGMMLSRPE